MKALLIAIAVLAMMFVGSAMEPIQIIRRIGRAFVLFWRYVVQYEDDTITFDGVSLKVFGRIWRESAYPLKPGRPRPRSNQFDQMIERLKGR